MIEYKDISDITLYQDYETFCANQGTCSNCALDRAGLINADYYNQPCKTFYDLLCIIDDLRDKTY